MDIKINTYVGVWKNLIGKAADAAAQKVAEQIRSDSLDYIPKQEGALRDNWEGNAPVKGEKDGEYYLVSDLVYSGYQWYGMRADKTHVVKHYTTSGTGKAWVDAAADKEKGKWEKVAQNAFTEALK